MISIIVVGYNSRHDLKECLDSVLESSYKNIRVIFVDNGSSDNSVRFVRENYPRVITIENGNTGYPDGANLGIRQALKMKTDYVFLLNPDAMVTKDCFEILMKKANSQTILQPLILINMNGTNTQLVNTTGDYLNFLGFCYCNDYKADRFSIREKNIVIASGAAALIPSEIINEIGDFDKNFFMYHEDADLSYRARLYGFNIKLIPGTLAYHKYSFSKNKSKMYYAERNRFLFLYKNFSAKYLLLIAPMMIINEILMIIYSLFTGWFGQKIKVYFVLPAFISQARSQRKKYLPNIKKEESKLKKYIGPEISFSEVKSPLFAPYILVLRIYWVLIKPLI